VDPEKGTSLRTDAWRRGGSGAGGLGKVGSVKIVGGLSGEGGGDEGGDGRGLDVDDAVGILQAPRDEQSVLLSEREASFVKELRGDDRVGDTGFIFEADKDKALSRARALAADDGSSDGDGFTLVAEGQIGGTGDAVELGANQSHRMGAGGEFEAAKVSADTLAQGHGGERGEGAEFCEWE
jgi:hypothetical protein